MRVNPTGSVEVLTGCHSHGQGHETTFAQLVSERLGIPIDTVSIVHGDTDKVQFGMGTYGSRSGAVGMSAIVKALDKVEAKAKKVAAFMLEASEGDIEFKDGKFTVAGTDKSAAWGEVTLNAYVAHKFTGAELEPGLKEGAFYDPTNFTFPAGCHICEVEIDPDTGHVEIVGWTAVDDFGIDHQSDDRRGPGARRRRAGRRPGADRERDLRQGGPARVRLVHGLRDAARREFPDAQGRHHHDEMPVQSARHQGLRRGGRDRGSGGGHQRHHRRDRNGRFGHAGNGARGLGGDPQGREDAARSRIRETTSMYEFKYHRPTTVRQAVNLLAKNAEAKILAGGHSLIPVMKLRLAKPSDLVDLSQVEGLSGIELQRPLDRDRRDDPARRRGEFAGGEGALPVLAEVPGSIGDPAVRHRGTIGGSLANNDPNADYPAAVLGLGATIITNKRRIAADDFFKGMFETALEPDEIITKVQFPIAKKAAYEKFKHPASGFALVGVFVSKRGSDIRVAVTGAGSNGVFRVKSFEEALKKRFSPKSIEGMTIPADGMNTDIHGSAEYRAHLVAVLARRALAKA